MIYGSLFAGVGGFDLGFDAAGWRCAWQVEIDPWCRKVLANHWPDVDRHIDVRDVSGHTLAPVDVISFGSPCQDLSIAGKRAGLAGARSGLFGEAVRIIREMREATDGASPRFAVWENVVGALTSSGGRDFAAVLDSLADAGAMELEWRVLDARWFGVPQRRRRIFLVAAFHPRAGDAPPLLPVGESGRGDPDPSDTPRSGAAPRARDGAAFDGWHPDHITALTTKAGSTFDDQQTSQLVTFRKTRRAQSAEDPEAWERCDETNTLNTFDVGDTRATSLIAYSVTPEGGQGADLRASETDVAQALTALNGQSHDRGVRIVDGASVRRLTPLECERLMGWPDGHTRVGEMSDTQRYKMCGNGVVAPVAEWIARRITDADAGTPGVDDTTTLSSQHGPAPLPGVRPTHRAVG